MAKQLGMGGNIMVSTNKFPVTQWEVTTDNDVQDVTDTDSGGWAAFLAGVNSAEFSATAFWGGGASTLSTAFAIGSTVAVTLKISSGGTDTVTGNVIVSNHVITNDAKTPVQFKFTGKFTGAPTYPS